LGTVDALLNMLSMHIFGGCLGYINMLQVKVEMANFKGAFS